MHEKLKTKNINQIYNYTPLSEPTPITKQEWPEGTVPIVHIRTMTYQHENFICDCVEGILMQKTTFPVLILIHDDASTDGTAKIVREYEAKYPKLIKAFFQQENSYGKPDKIERREKFLSWRIGKYEALCEGDDYWSDPLKLEKQMKFLDENHSYGAVFHNVNFKYEKDNTSKIYLNKNLYNKTFSFKEIVKNNPIHYSSFMFRMDLLNDELIDILKLGEIGDTPFFIYIASVSKVYYLNFVGSTYRINQNSSWTPLSKTKQYTKVINSLKNINTILKPEQRKIINKKISGYYYTLSTNFNVEFPKDFIYLIEALIYSSNLNYLISYFKYKLLKLKKYLY